MQPPRFTHVQTASSLVCAAGAASTLGTQSLLKKCTRILVVTDKGVVAAGLLARVQQGLGDRVALVDDDVVPDADCAHVDALAARAKDANVDAIVALGGGSVMDTAKAVAAVLAKGQSIVALEGFATVRAKILPLACVPTTAGTGSESTQFVVVKDRAAHTKRILMDTALVPALAVLDPELIVGLPAHVTRATAVDALTHACEALVSKLANPVGSALALDAARRIVVDGALARSLRDPTDLGARADMLIAANLAGQAVSTSMLGACHALAHALGARHGIAHGVANGACLVAVLRANAPASSTSLLRLAHALDAHSVDDVLARIDGFVHDIGGVPRRLRDLGVPENDLDALADLAHKDPDMGTNPVKLSRDDVRALYGELW
jgi:alcohol dehydrogenase class IV